MRTAFTDDPLAKFALASSGDAPAALPWALELERSAATAPWLDACAPVAARQGASEGGASAWGAVANPAHFGQARRSSVVEFFPRHRGRPRVEGARPGGFGRSDEGFHVEQIGRIEPRAAAFRTGPGRRSRGPAGLR